jgi:hypothetical protein
VNQRKKDNYCVVIALGAQRDRRLFRAPELLGLGETALGPVLPALVRVLSSISQNRREPLIKNFAKEDISYVPKSAARKA